MENQENQLTYADLKVNFYGTENYYPVKINLARRTTVSLLLTDGVMNVVQKAQANWLVQKIGIYQMDRKIRQNPMLQDFQVWVLSTSNKREEFAEEIRYPFLTPSKGGLLTCWEDTPKEGTPAIIKQEFPFTDFPLPEAVLWVGVAPSGQEKVIYLPSED